MLKAATLAANGRYLMELDLTDYESVNGKVLSALIRRLETHRCNYVGQDRGQAQWIPRPQQS